MDNPRLGRIILVASDAEQCTSLREILDRTGHQVVEFDDAAQALAAMQPQSPFLMLSPRQAWETPFQKALRDTSTGCFFIDTEGCIRWVNDAWLHLHGYSTLDEVIGQPLSITQVDGEFEAADTIVRKLLAGRPAPAQEFSRKRQDGSIGYHKFSAHRVMEGDRVIGLEGFLIDTTQFHESEECFQKLFQRMLDGFALHEMIFDEAGKPVDYRFLAVNPAFEELTGLKSDAILGKRVLEVLPGLECHWIENYGHVVLTGEPFCFEQHIASLGKDFEVAAYRPKEGQFACVFRDVTLQRENEKEIRRLAYLHELLSQVNQAIVRATSRDELLQAVCRIAGKYGHFHLTWIRVLDTDGTQFAAMDRDEPPAPFDIEAAQCGVNREAVRTGLPVICNSISPRQPDTDCPAYAKSWGISSCAAFPIRAGGSVYGSLFVHAAEKGFFGQPEVQLLNEAALDVSFALDKLAADEARHHLEERFAVAFEHFPAPASISLLTEGTYLQVNLQFESVFGFRREEVIGFTSASLGFMTGELRAELAALIAREGRISGLETQMRAKDGRTVECLLNVEKIRIGDRDGLLSMFLDVTDRKRAAEELRESEERLQLTLAAANLVAWEICPEFNRLHEAGPVGLLFGRDNGFKHAGMADLEADIHPLDRARVRSTLSSALSGERPYHVEYRAQLPDGGEKWIAANGTLLRNGEGQPARLLGVARDVTERKQTEMSLRESQAALAAAQRIAQLGSWQWDIRTDVAYWSDEMFRIFGRARGKLEQHGARFLEMVHPSDQPLVSQALAAALNGTAEYDVEYRVLRPDGVERVIHAQAEVLRDEAGRPAMMRGTAHDITERKLADQALRASEEKYRITFQNIPAGVIVHEAGGSISLMNDEAVRLSGCSLDQPAGTADRSLPTLREDGSVCPHADLPVSRCFRTGEPQSESVLGVRRSDGTIFWAVYSATPVLDPVSGKVVRVVLACRDITLRKQAEDALRRVNQQLRLLADNLHEGVLAYDMDRRLIFINPAVQNLTGYPEEDLWRENFICWIHPDDRKRMLAFWDDLFHGRSFVDEEYKLVTKDGQTKWVSSSWGPLRDEAGRQVGVQGVERDITERKRAEEERARLEEQLQQAQKLESIGRLAGGVAHDFNNLLTVINGYSEMILKGLQRQDPLHDDLVEIRKAGGRAAALTRQLLAFSRKQVIEPRPVNLNALIEDSEDMLARIVGEDIELVTDLDPAAGHAMADPGQLHQVLMNLVVNARDAMPSGGLLTLRTSRVQLDRDAAAAYPGAAPGSYAVIEVVDTGIGMSPEIQQKMFEPFFTTKTEDEGTGLGLSTVYGIIRQAGGWISVESRMGIGSTFRIGLPLLGHSDPHSLPGTSLPAALEGSETILVVEDQQEMRKLALALLRRFHYRTLEASSGGEALLIAENHPGPIHLMLTDVVMPHMTGTQLAVRLRPLRPDMKVLFMSGYTADVIARQGVLDAGIEYIEKPFSPEALAFKIRAVLGEPRPAPKLLVVDDEDGIRGLFSKVLTGGGYDVAVACDGEQALKMLQVHPFDLVITDLVMPNREGLETIQSIRRTYPRMKIIAISGAFGGTHLLTAAKLGADATLVKPASPERLLETVRKTLTQVT